MNIVFNTRHPSAAASLFYASGLKRLTNVTFFDAQDYSKYDIALFMGFEKDQQDIIFAKKSNSNIRIGVLDPRGKDIENVIHHLDFLIVDSLEMIDFFSFTNLPIFKYYEYTDIKPKLKEHSDKETITIGYHGNKVHLMSLNPHVTAALEKLALEFRIEFNAVYNINQLGIWNLGLPDNIKVNHVQFDEKTYSDEISKIDIGIVPAFLPIYKRNTILNSNWIFKKIFLQTNSDYLLRFKMLTNAGRIIIFSLLGIPVVSDMFPSAIEFINHEEDGYLAYSTGGWYSSLKKLIQSKERRIDISKRQFEKTNKIVNYDNQNLLLISFLTERLKDSETRGEILFDTFEQKELSVFQLYTYWIKLRINQIMIKLRG